MSKKMFSRERGKLRFSALLILIGLLLFGCDPTMVTITYNANGGEGEMKPQAVESGVEVKLSANTFTKDGSDFTGWNEAADGSGKAYADGATVTPTGNLTLYAQWQAKSTPENPGTEDPDPENPGTENPDPEQPGGGESDVNLQLTEGTAVFDATSGLKLPFTVVDTGALTQEELTQLLTNATKTVTLFTADNETGTPVETGISHGVDGSTPYILVAAAAFPQESTTYSKIEVVLETEGYVTQTLTYTNVSVNPEQPGGGESDADLQLTEGTAVFDKTTGLTLPFDGPTLPADASASVSLGGAEVNSEHVSISENAVVVALAALTNDTVDMTVTVTVSVEGYNNAVLPYEGVNTVWMPENVTAALADSEAKIGGETVTVTVSQTDGSDSLDAVRILSGTYSNGTSATLEIGGDGRSFTAPILADASETGTTVTISLVLGKENAAESDTVTADNLSLTVYPSTHVRYDGRIFQQVKGFDFSTENTAKTAGVTVKRGAGGTWNEKSNWETVTYSDGEGYTFTTNDDDGSFPRPAAILISN